MVCEKGPNGRFENVLLGTFITTWIDHIQNKFQMINL